jgi:hypothetical protein
MATLQIKTTKGVRVTVIYPANRPTGYCASVRFRIGKKTVLPAYTNAILPNLVQFQCGQRIIMFMLGDLFRPSYWHRIRNAYTLFGQLDLDTDLKVSTGETGRVREWLTEQCRALGVVVDVQPDNRETQFSPVESKA